MFGVQRPPPEYVGRTITIEEAANITARRAAQRLAKEAETYGRNNMHPSMETEGGLRTSINLNNVENPALNQRREYPRMFYHPKNANRIVHSAEEAASLVASDPGWQNKPYPPAQVEEKPVPVVPPVSLQTLGDRMMRAEVDLLNKDEMIGTLQIAFRDLEAKFKALEAAVTAPAEEKSRGGRPKKVETAA